MIYLLIPITIWGIALALLQYARGQRGFDLFFRHFVVFSLAGLIGFVLYKANVGDIGFLIFMGWVGLHSALLFTYALAIAIGKRFRRRSLRMS
jgi:TctA family transporter